MAKNRKKQPFNYNAAYILARTAQDLKQVDVATQFFRICKDDAVRLQSGTKLIQSFGGLIDLLYENKKFDEVVKECEEFVKLEGDDTVDRLKPVVMERMIQAYARQGKTEEALKLVNTFVKIEEKKGGWYYHMLKAWVLREAGQLDESAKLYE